MALIKCKDCNNDVSDSAEACPKCGAPIPKVVSPDQEQCPFCMTVVAKSATVCSSCHAKKGYTQSRGVVYGKMLTLWWGILFPIIMMPVSFIFGQGFGSLVTLILLIVVVLSVVRLIRGPVWYQTRSVN